MQPAVCKKGRISSIKRSNKAIFITLIPFTPIFLFSIIFLAASATQPDVKAQSDDDEYFYSVTPNTYDIDVDGYEDSVSLEIDVDTTGGYVDVGIEGYLEDSYGYVVDFDFTITSIYDEDTEYSYVYLTVESGDPGYYNCYLELYDDLAYWEDSWSDSFYLYPMGYGRAPIITTTPTPYETYTPFPTPYQTYTPFPTPTPADGGLSGAVLGGTVAAVIILIAAPVLFTINRNRKRRTASNARIRELKAQMERWRAEGYDVSELEDLFK
jgi:hypothetical protein